MSQVTFSALMSGVGVAVVLLLVAVFLTLREIADAATSIQTWLEMRGQHGEGLANRARERIAARTRRMDGTGARASAAAQVGDPW